MRLYRERKNLGLRKKSLMQTIELGEKIGQEDFARRSLAISFKDIVREEEMQDMDDRLLRDRLSLLTAYNSDEQLLRLKKAFNVLDHTKDGKISAEDVVRVVRASTGNNVSLSAARQLVEEWDLDDDKSLDYSEFMRLLLSDDGNKRKG